MRIKLNGSYYLNFTDFAFVKSLDSVASTFSFVCRFDREKRELFRPLSFQKVEFFNDEDNLFFTGTVIDYQFSSQAETDLVQLSGYSLPGILEDCSIPYSSYPLESNNMNLKEIISKFIKPFGIKLVVDSSAQSDAIKNYSKTSAAPEDSVKEYISKLAAQRNLILSHTEKGELFLFKPNPQQKPVFFFDTKNSISMTLSVSGQNIHSEITNLRQPKPKKTEKKKKPKATSTTYEDELGYTHTVSNPAPGPANPPKKVKERPQYYDTLENPLVSIYRPAVKVLTEGEDYDTKDAAKNQLADELKNIKVSIIIDSWKEVGPGQVIEVQNEEIYFEEKIKLMIESVQKTENTEERRMEINAVPVEAFTGETPKNIFK